jgi:PDZ domain-containing protein
MNRRSLTFGVAAVLLLAMLVLIARLPVPYVILVPGPVTDTLGQVPATDTANGRPGGEVIRISGSNAHVQATTGHLYLTTVGLLPGSCSDDPTVWQAIKAWFDSTQTVEPKQVQCPPGESSAAVQEQGVEEMTQSQISAVYAALVELGHHPAGNRVVVLSIASGSPAAQQLQPGDLLLSADGTRIRTPQQLVDLIQAARPGSDVSLAVERDGARTSVRVATTRGPNGKARLGISIASRPYFPGIDVTIGIDPNVIGGPSAGTALALGIIDKLTPGGLTGGRTIAGTGTIDRQGRIGPIGGIQQKVAAAVSAGATVFFAPASECADAKAAAPSSLTLVSVTTLKGAVAALEAIKAGSSAFPHC